MSPRWTMQIDVLASQISDNFFVALHHQRDAWLIDPVDAALALKWLDDNQLILRGILNTHWHPDHVGGNAHVLEAFPDAKVWASQAEADVFENITSRPADVYLNPGDEVPCGDASLRVISVPGHTAGHIAFLYQDHLFSGDVLFRAGSGHCKFGGDPATLFQTYRDILRQLPPTTTLYPGHDYSLKNLAMARQVLPQDVEIQRAYDDAFTHTPRQFYPARLNEELRINLFLRYDDPDVQGALQAQFAHQWATQRELSQDDHEATWRTLRHLRDHWDGEQFSFS